MLAHPGRYTYCIGEREEASPWPSLAVEHGFAPTDDTVALLAADAPLTVYDQRSRTAPDLLSTIAASLAVLLLGRFRFPLFALCLPLGVVFSRLVPSGCRAYRLVRR